MLKKILDRAGVVGPAANAQGDGLLPALQNLDGFGTLGAPAAQARALPAKAIGEPPDAEHPPGYYGAAEAPRALNAYAGGRGFAPLDVAGLRLARAEPERAARRRSARAAAAFRRAAGARRRRRRALARRRLAPAGRAGRRRAGAAGCVRVAAGARGKTRRRQMVSAGAHDVAGLCPHRREPHRPHQRAGAGLAVADPVAAHLLQSRRAARRRSRDRRTRLLSADLLAGVAGGVAAERRGRAKDRRLHEAGRVGAVRHPRRLRTDRRRRGHAGAGMAEPFPEKTRSAAAGARAEKPCGVSAPSICSTAS